MNDEELLRVEAALRRLADMVGAGDIMEPQHYRDGLLETALTGESVDRPFSLRRRVVAEVKALERHLALLDRDTYEKSLGIIREVAGRTIGPEEKVMLPDDVVIEIENETARGIRTIHFSELPLLDEARHILRQLAAGIAEE